MYVLYRRCRQETGGAADNWMPIEIAPGGRVNYHSIVEALGKE